jgi:hydroxyethylthiazole kinase-like uncharacterized protein yjeF
VKSQPGSSIGELTLAAAGGSPWLLPSAAEMAALDRTTIERGTSGLQLMERAGASIAHRLSMLYPAAKRAVVFCGPGNNGGDGLVIARLLRKRGYWVDAVLVSADKYSSECLAQLSQTSDVRVYGAVPGALEKLSLASVSSQEIIESIGRSSLVIDALLGTGQRAAPRGGIAELVALATQAKRIQPSCCIVSVDIPTGVDADTGAVFDPHIEADRTLCIELVKRGMLQFPARGVCGAIEALSIGITHDGGAEFSLVSEASVPRLSSRAIDTHKGLLGRVLVVGGSLRMPGAPLLSALAALRTGAGIVSRVVRKGWSTLPALPEAMFEVLEGDGDTLHEGDREYVLEAITRHDVVVLGPGLGTEASTGALLAHVLDALRGGTKKLILDADALNLVGAHAISLRDLSVAITPHPGEAARLLGVPSSSIQLDRYGGARELARRFGVVAVLKGAGTVVHNGTIGRLIADGTPYLATPGSGDVLAGIIAACACRTDSLFDAASVGGWIHAQAGVRAARRSGGPFLASEITREVGGLVRALE